ncbi:MAG: DNA-directed RNA polymerase subunit omega [Actinomycetaceae bacterium]|nr:DNA-directed RNA polymerase subunit omega [Actinomycetaceae bacterium]MDY6083167.1 DNA-directed RNA polymerase subunit omega [Actinomycetaceae bacterium]
MYGTQPEPEGVTNPPIDDLLEKIPSKYAMATIAATRARQINSYRQELTRGDGDISDFGPLVESSPEDKPLSIALHEVAEGKLQWSDEDE